MNDLNDWMIRALERRMANLNSVISERPISVKPLQQRLEMLEQETAIRKRLSLAADEEERCEAQEELASFRARLSSDAVADELMEKCGAGDVFELIIHKDHGKTPDHSPIAGASCIVDFGGADKVVKILPADGKITRKPPPKGGTAKLTVVHQLKRNKSPRARMSFGLFKHGQTKFSLVLDLEHRNWKTSPANVIIKGVQCRLANLGIYSGPIDGELTWRTKEAIAYFQRIKGIPMTGDIRTLNGELDNVLLSVLESEHGC